MEKYHNNKNKKFKKSIATALMGTVLVAPIALSSASANADTVPAGSQPAQTEWVANSVSTVRAEMQAQGLNLSHVQGKYIVRKGDTLLAISQAANESMAEIAKVNHITNLNLIYVGQVLYLGSNGVVKAQSASANNEVANNAGTSVAANVMSNGGNAASASIATPANNGIMGNGTVAAHPSRTAEQARNAAKVTLGHSGAKTDTSVDTSTKAPAKTASAKTTSSVKTDTSAKSSANADKTSSSASSVKSSVASSATSSKTSSAISVSASHVSSSTTSKPAASTNTSSASSKAPAASSTTSSQAQSSQTSKPAASTTS